jgi:peptidoglycan/xylan/chitin deacetylase (PgdA/CDA1 family)
MKLALKVDVETLRGTREGVPRLIDMLKRHGAGATFLFSVGPDHHGLNGKLWPGPDLARRGTGAMRLARDAGFDTGLRGYNPVAWRNRVAHAKPAWIEAELHRAVDRYAKVFGEPPHVHGAAGWQMDVQGLRLTQRLGFAYCSDGRGRSPHLPVWNAELIRCPQFPTTLPTLDELIGRDDVVASNVAAHLLARTASTSGDQVFTLRAELEGSKAMPAFEQLILGWRAQGYEIVSLRSLYEAVEPLALPSCEVGWGSVPGRAGEVLVQKDEFLADVIDESRVPSAA